MTFVSVSTETAWLQPRNGKFWTSRILGIVIASIGLDHRCRWYVRCRFGIRLESYELAGVSGGTR